MTRRPTIAAVVVAALVIVGAAAFEMMVGELSIDEIEALLKPAAPAAPAR